MAKFDYEEFNKRYKKFEKNNLPTPFWDKERQVLEYVFYEKDNNGGSFNISRNLTDSFIDKISLYYPFNGINITFDGKRKIGSCHGHTFEDVVRSLYNYPVSFSIPRKYEKYYTKRELSYLRILKNYLLLVGVSDILDNAKISRYRNKLVKKYGKAIILQLDNREINDIINGKKVFFAVKKSRSNNDIKKYSKGELQYLVVDNKCNFRLFIEYVEKRKQKYEEIKKQVKVDKVKNNDDVIVYYFKVLEIFQAKK